MFLSLLDHSQTSFIFLLSKRRTMHTFHDVINIHTHRRTCQMRVYLLHVYCLAGLSLYVFLRQCSVINNNIVKYMFSNYTFSAYLNIHTFYHINLLLNTVLVPLLKLTKRISYV